jgi:hypothetical protein
VYSEKIGTSHVGGHLVMLAGGFGKEFALRSEETRALSSISGSTNSECERYESRLDSLI